MVTGVLGAPPAGAVAPAAAQSARRRTSRNPFDTASGTIVLGLVLTVVLYLVVRQLV
jgi:hypothetical protein